MTYLKEHEIWGWHHHITDGNYKYVCSVGGATEDVVYFLVERDIDGSTKYYIERLSEKWRESNDIRNAFFVDSGLTYNGWSTVPGDTVLIYSPSYMSGDTGYLYPTGTTSDFTSANVGKKFFVKHVDGYEVLLETIALTASPNRLDVRLLNDVPSNMQNVDIADWAELASTFSGLDHLEGKEVIALVDGSPVEAGTVSSGEVTLGVEGAIVHIGLSYTGVLAPLPLEIESENGTSQGYPRSYGQIYLRLFESVGGKVGTGSYFADVDDITFDPIIDLPLNYGEPLPPFTGVKQVSSTGGVETDLTIYVKQDLPLPLTLQSIIPEVDFG
jgi:hypothetical protein